MAWLERRGGSTRAAAGGAGEAAEAAHCETLKFWLPHQLMPLQAQQKKKKKKHKWSNPLKKQKEFQFHLLYLY